MKRMIFLLLIVLVGAFHSETKAQKVAIKTNALSAVFLNANAGFEVGLAPRWTLDLSADYNGWTLSHERKWKHWLVQPEVRYWFCDRFAGHFLGVHALGGKCNVGGIKNSISFLGTDFSKLSNRRYQGWFVGAGLAYGHAWILGKHWNLEAEFGAGWVYTRYDVYPCAECGTRLAKGRSHHYVGPTKLAVNLVYTF